MLDYQEFREQLVRKLHRRYHGQKITVKNILKINQEKEGIVLGEGGVAPIFYTDDLYQVFGEEEDWKAVFQYVETIREQKIVNLGTRWMTDWESARTMVRPYVVNYERNREFLTNNQSVYQVVLDLAVAYYLDLSTEQGQSVIQVSEEMRKNWGITVEELQEQSRKNVVYEIRSLRQMLEDQAPWVKEENENDDFLCLSNREAFRGAAGMLIGDSIRNRAQEEECSFYILPSSLHEVLLVKDYGTGEHAETLKQIVSEINADPVALPISDYLSDSVYYYDRAKDEIRIVA